MRVVFTEILLSATSAMFVTSALKVSTNRESVDTGTTRYLRSQRVLVVVRDDKVSGFVR